MGPSEEVCSNLAEAAKLASDMASLTTTEHRARLPGGVNFQTANLYMLLGLVEVLGENLKLNVLGQKAHVGVDTRTAPRDCSRSVCGANSILPMARLCGELEEAEYALTKYVTAVSNGSNPSNGPAVLNLIASLQTYLGAGKNCWAKLCSADGGRIALEAPAEPDEPDTETPARMIQRYGGSRRRTRRRSGRKHSKTRVKRPSGRRRRRRKTRRKK